MGVQRVGPTCSIIMLNIETFINVIHLGINFHHSQYLCRGSVEPAPYTIYGFKMPHSLSIGTRLCKSDHITYPIKFEDIYIHNECCHDHFRIMCCIHM